MNRTLAGHLEDLDLDEVVKVIALSRRSGVLEVNSPDGHAELFFRQGRLMRGRQLDSSSTVAQLLTTSGVLREAEAQGATDGELLEDFIARIEGARGDRSLLVRVDDALADELAALATRVMLSRSGSFLFRVGTDDGALRRYPRDCAITLPAGIDGEELAREVKKRRAERRADPLSPLSSRPSRAEKPRSDSAEIVFVDDDAALLAALERNIGRHVATTMLSTARDAIESLGDLNRPGQRAMVVDLVMPRSSGRGILGGLEVLRRAHAAGVSDRVFVALDEPHEDAQRLVRELGGAGILQKPKSRDSADDIAPLVNPVLLRLDRPPLTVRGYDLARELARELGDAAEDWHAEARPPDEGARNLETLKALLGELNDPAFEEEIPLLILRFASAFFVRGALFSVDHDAQELVGLGGFGVGGDDPGRLVRSIRIPISADTVFVRAIHERSGVRQTFWDSEWNTKLSQALGGPRPREVYCATLISPRGVEALIYADNAAEPRPFPDIALLEIFLQQSAAAIERSTLARQVKRLLSPA